jgi:hypothetical protein
MWMISVPPSLSSYQADHSQLSQAACDSVRLTAFMVNPLNAKLNPICHLLALLGGATIVVVKG